MLYNVLLGGIFNAFLAAVFTNVRDRRYTRREWPFCLISHTCVGLPF
jgi:hypothetical protein